MSLDALVFDAYGTLFDVHSVASRCESFWRGKGAALSQLWRTKQLEYTWQRSLMQRYAPFSQVTREALAYACEALGLQLTVTQMEALMGEYLMLSTYPDVAQAMKRLQGRKLAILSNGSPDMLEPLVAHSGLELDADRFALPERGRCRVQILRRAARRRRVGGERPLGAAGRVRRHRRQAPPHGLRAGTDRQEARNDRQV